MGENPPQAPESPLAAAPGALPRKRAPRKTTPRPWKHPRGPNDKKYWIFAALEALGEASPRKIVWWFAPYAFSRPLTLEEFEAEVYATSKRCVQLANAKRYPAGPYLRAKDKKFQRKVEAHAYWRHVYVLTAYGRARLEDVRHSVLPGLPPIGLPPRESRPAPSDGPTASS